VGRYWRQHWRKVLRAIRSDPSTFTYTHIYAHATVNSYCDADGYATT